MTSKNRNTAPALAIPAALAVLAVSAALSGCNTPDPVARDYDPIYLKTADLTIALTYVDEPTLEVRHGRNDSRHYSNPYYGFPAMITKKNFYVFELEAATTESTVNFRLEDINLRKGLVDGSAKSHEYLTRIWSYYNGGQSIPMEKTLDATLLPKEFTVSPGEPVSGYLAFAENYPADGKEALISFYMTTPDGQSGKLDLPIYFYEDNVSDVLPENTGIFAEDNEG